ncbi:MAG: CDGSH iron-sulfur domain-containing protein [Acidiferrobacteraceae bacterium]
MNKGSEKHRGEQPPAVNVAQIYKDGPLEFHAQIHMEGLADATTVALCRCGASANKPFCDGSHVKVDFKEAGEPKTGESTPLKGPGGPLRITVIPDGPLKVEGPLEVRSAAGRTVVRSDQLFFCRCGASANKPFCDGSHKKPGLKSG